MRTINPHPSYYAVIFTSKPSDFSEGYLEMSLHMEILARQQPGFLGLDSVKDLIGITISYWENLESIKNWKINSEHIIAQQRGKEKWYKWYNVKICKIEREYEFGLET